MTKSERNNAFSKMLKEFPKVFGRVSFRERLMLGVAFDFAITETHDLENKLLGERCNQLLKDKGKLTDKNKQLELIILGNQEEIANLEHQIEKKTDELQACKYAMTMSEKVEKQLREQIEKMKCCENCKFKRCNKSSQYQTCWYCKNKDKWQLGR